MCDTKNIYFTITANNLDNVVVAWRVLLPYIEDLVPCSIPQSFCMEVLECVSVCGGTVGGGSGLYLRFLTGHVCGEGSVWSPARVPAHDFTSRHHGALVSSATHEAHGPNGYTTSAAHLRRERERPWKTNSGNDNNKPPELRHNSQ